MSNINPSTYYIKFLVNGLYYDSIQIYNDSNKSFCGNTIAFYTVDTIYFKFINYFNNSFIISSNNLNVTLEIFSDCYLEKCSFGFFNYTIVANYQNNNLCTNYLDFKNFSIISSDCNNLMSCLPEYYNSNSRCISK